MVKRGTLPRPCLHFAPRLRKTRRGRNARCVFEKSVFICVHPWSILFCLKIPFGFPGDDELFHVVFDLGERFQVPGEQYVATGRTYEKDGFDPKWRAIRDDQGRIMVAICYNMHLGDAWEWADDPRYPEKFASMAFRLGIDYIMYSMTH